MSSHILRCELLILLLLVLRTGRSTSVLDSRSRRGFVDLGEDLRVPEEVVFLFHTKMHTMKVSSAFLDSVERERVSSRAFARLTSSPTLILLPPQPGRRTLSPALTLTGTISPFFGEGAPGPTAMTVASGMVVDVEDEGMKRPDAVF